jgi:hypothetical protein
MEEKRWTFDYIQPVEITFSSGSKQKGLRFKLRIEGEYYSPNSILMLNEIIKARMNPYSNITIETIEQNEDLKKALQMIQNLEADIYKQFVINPEIYKTIRKLVKDIGIDHFQLLSVYLTGVNLEKQGTSLEGLVLIKEA